MIQRAAGALLLFLPAVPNAAQAASVIVTVGELDTAIEQMKNKEDAIERLVLERIEQALAEADLELGEGELLFSESSENLIDDGALNSSDVRVNVVDSLLRSALERILEDEIDEALSDSELARSLARLQSSLKDGLNKELDQGFLVVDLPSPEDEQIPRLYTLLLLVPARQIVPLQCLTNNRRGVLHKHSYPVSVMSNGSVSSIPPSSSHKAGMK